MKPISSSDVDCGSTASSNDGCGAAALTTNGNNEDQSSDDYGFSLSDGLYEKGVYVSALRPRGPATAPGGLQLYDRILQVRSSVPLPVCSVPEAKFFSQVRFV